MWAKQPHAGQTAILKWGGALLPGWFSSAYRDGPNCPPAEGKRGAQRGSPSEGDSKTSTPHRTFGCPTEGSAFSSQLFPPLGAAQAQGMIKMLLESRLGSGCGSYQCSPWHAPRRAAWVPGGSGGKSQAGSPASSRSEPPGPAFSGVPAGISLEGWGPFGKKADASVRCQKPGRLCQCGEKGKQRGESASV